MKQFLRDMAGGFLGIVIGLLLFAAVNYAFAGSAGQSPCHEHNYDIYHVAKSVMQKRPKEELLKRVTDYSQWLTPERLANLKAWIDSAYEVPDILEWRRVNTLKCEET